MKSEKYLKSFLFIFLIAVIIFIAVFGTITSLFLKEEKIRSNEVSVTYSSDDIYENITFALSEFRNNTSYNGVIDQNRVDEAVKKVRSSYPEYFWLDGYCTAVSGNKTDISFMTLNDYTSAQVKTMYSDMISEAEKIIAQIPSGSDEYSKALYVHDYLVDNTRYASEKAVLNENGLWGTAYGCLVEGEAVCQGYAEAYQLILNRLGIECGVCSGNSDRGKHAWNYVKVCGQYYWVDVTWDDPEMESEIAFLMHDYFMINDEMLLRTRSIDAENYYVPSCKSLDSNYYVRRGAFINEYDIDAISDVVEDSSDTHCIEVMFGSKDTFDTAKQKLFEEEERWLTGLEIENGGSLSYINDEKMLTIQIRY